MVGKKTAYFLIVFSNLMLIGCGGGSSSGTSGDSNPPVEDTSPIAFAGLDQIVIVNNLVTLDGSGSTDNDGSIIDYKWTEDTTELSNEKSFDHNFTTLGNHIITLTVTDDDNMTDTDEVIITVTDNITLDDFENVTTHNPSFDETTTDVITHFSGSQNCAQCHDGIKDANDTDVSIVKAWQGTMMANAATDPFWRAKVATEVKEHPEYKEIIEGKCSRCHTPMANVEATYNGDTVSLLGDGFLNHNNEYYDAAMQGVSCTLCHQIENTPELGTTEGFTGAFVINTDNIGTERKIYGPFQDPKVEPMQRNVQFTPEYSPHMDDSKHCATCHNLETPVIATDGTIMNDTFPEQAAYTEWEYSEFNGTKSCQDCHMPKAEGSVYISKQNLIKRSPFFQHKFLGANTYMLEILKNNREKLGVLADEARFNESITDTKNFLKGENGFLKAAADVNITQSSFENGVLSFDVNITNHSGHKFPTGFPSRRAWLHVTIKNSAGQIVFESGDINSSSGQIKDVVYDTATNTYEPHYDKITDESQVQIYETILQDTDDNMTYILLHALHYLKDNRILPKGLNKDDENLPETINPHGNAETDTNFNGGSDTVTYEITVPANDSYTITATLHYQALSYGFAQDMYKNAELREVALMKLLDANVENRYETISTDSISITVP